MGSQALARAGRQLEGIDLRNKSQKKLETPTTDSFVSSRGVTIEIGDRVCNVANIYMLHSMAGVWTYSPSI